MKRTFFDKIILVIIVLLFLLSIGLASFTTYGTQKVLIQEKQNNLINEATLLSEQTISAYIQGSMSLEYLQQRLNEFEDSLMTSVWYCWPTGDLIAASNPKKYNNIPQNILRLDKSIDVKEGFTQTGTFYDIFEETMISIGIPVYMENKLEGYLILHTSISELDSLQDDMLSVMYMPILVMILVMGVVLAFLSGTVLRPIAKINDVAKEYAKGNFDVKIGVKRKDELGELSDSLEYMASELSKLDEYRRDFIANISHDFRSPLTSIKGYLVAMLDGTIPVEKYQLYLNIVLHETGRLTKLTSSLLELNNFDTLGPILKCQDFDIVDVIRETRNTLEGVCREKDIDFRLQCPAEDTMVYADKTKIGQVVYNLVDNAIKFSPEKGRITVTVYDKNEKIFVSVKDEGPGIERQKQNKIWVRFYKSDVSRGKDKKGTGLGLAITKEIIKAHGENIDLVSTEGAGSEFIFTLTKQKNKDNT